MKKFTLGLFVLLTYHHLQAQSCTATITADGPTSFCGGNSVILSANSPLSLKKADFGGGARALSAAFSINGKGYVGTGYDRTVKKDFWEYDPAGDTWTQRADFGGVARGYAAAFSIGSKGYIGTGNNGNNLKDFWEYDPVANTWTKKADFGGTAREYATGFSIGSKGYIGTGLSAGGNYTKDIWEYDPSVNVWTKKADFGGVGRYSAAAFTLGSKAYLGTGVASGGVNQKDFWEFDPASNSWIQKADFGGMERFGSFAFSLGTKGFIGTGYTTSLTRDVWEYDPSLNQWTQRSDFSGTSIEFGIAFSTGSKAYAGTGIDALGFNSNIWEYNPFTSYLWSGGETTPDITVTTSGTYSVTITNTTIGCSAISQPVTVSVAQPSFADTTASVCNTFTWHDVTYTKSGDYPYTLINAGGCDSTITLHLIIKSIHSTLSKTDATCFGSATGSVTITPTDGIYPYMYRIGTIRQFVTDSVFTALKAGNYRITIIDAVGCAGVSDQVTISQEGALAYSYATTDAVCYGTPTGSFYINAMSGTAPYQYKFGTAGTYDAVHSYANLRPGNYRVFIKDAQGCTITTTPINVGQPPQVRASFVKTDENCPNKKDGSIVLTDSVGASPLLYKFGTVGSYNTTKTFTGLRHGNYRIFLKDANNCEGLSLLIPVVQLCSSITATGKTAGDDSQLKPVAVSKLLTYPNPSTGRFRLQLNDYKSGKAEIIISNESGMIVQQKAMNLQGFQNNIDINMQNNAPGIYFVKVVSEQGVQITKVVITYR